LTQVVLTETVVATVLREHSDGARVIVWGTFLFPYGAAAVEAGRALRRAGVVCEVWLTPTGSDIWQIAPQVQRVAQHILQDAVVAKIVTYSEQFAREIDAIGDVGDRVEVLCPAADAEHFRPPSDVERKEARRSLGIPDDAFVVSSHSNMRPIKQPDLVIAAASSVATRVKRPVILVMTGPRPNFDVSVDCTAVVLWRGVVLDVRPSIWAADVELNMSRHDSFNLSLAEAMLVGLPTCSTSVVGIAPGIEASGSGRLIEVPGGEGDAQAGVAAAAGWLAELAGDPQRCRRLGEAARQYAEDHYGMPRLVEEMRSLVGDG
jgi:glycosyltransferase involved in cell wall biosynthesis